MIHLGDIQKINGAEIPDSRHKRTFPGGRMNKPQSQRMEYRTVSGAWTPRPVYYCAYHKGYLTEGQVRQHHCTNKHGKGVCVKLCDTERKGVRVTHEQRIQSTLDKILNKLINIDMNTSRLQKQIKEMQNESKKVDMEDDGK